MASDQSGDSDIYISDGRFSFYCISTGTQNKQNTNNNNSKTKDKQPTKNNPLQTEETDKFIFHSNFIIS